jgi:hypothetical protein
MPCVGAVFLVVWQQSELVVENRNGLVEVYELGRQENPICMSNNLQHCTYINTVTLNGHMALNLTQTKRN